MSTSAAKQLKANGGSAITNFFGTGASVASSATNGQAVVQSDPNPSLRDEASSLVTGRKTQDTSAVVPPAGGSESGSSSARPTNKSAPSAITQGASSSSFATPAVTQSVASSSSSAVPAIVQPVASSSSALPSEQEQESLPDRAKSIEEVMNMPHLAKLRADPTGAKCGLTFRAILTFMVLVAFSWSEQFLTDTACLQELGADHLVDLVIRGMPPKLLAYLDSCLLDGIAWDVREVMSMLWSREHSRNKHGCYLIMLIRNSLHMYGGSSSRITAQGIFTRLRDHFSESYRASRVKYLYSLWNTAKFEEAPVGDMFYHWSLQIAAKYGPLPACCVEFGIIGLFGGWQTNFKMPSTLSHVFPASLVAMFEQYSGRSCAEGLNSSAVLAAALAKAAGKNVRGTNQCLPMDDPHLDQSSPVQRLLIGTECQLNFNNGFMFWSPLGNTKLPIDKSTAGKMDLLGFQRDSPRATVRLELTEEAHPENWANAPLDAQPTDNNPLGFEHADRILLRIFFTTKDGQVASVLDQRLTGRGDVLKRACLAMTLLDYAQKELPAEDFGPRRFDLTNISEANVLQGSKVWHTGRPEREELESRSGAVRYQCQNPECGQKFVKLSEVVWHYNLTNSLAGKAKPTKRALKCRAAAGITEKEQVTEERHLIPGQVGKKPSKNPDVYQCRAPGCGSTFKQWQGFARHFGFNGANGGPKKANYTGPILPVSSKELKCRAEHNPSKPVATVADLDRKYAEI